MPEGPPGHGPGAAAEPPSEDEAQVEAIARTVAAGTDGIGVPAELLEEREEPAGRANRGGAATPSGNLHAQIVTMGMSAKIKLALRGNKDARQILIHDRNKLIRRLVLQNVRITDGEILSLARNRNVDEELLHVIVERREWMQNYQIKLAIVVNPKTPLVSALKHVGSMAERDLRHIAKSKDVADAVGAQARRILFTRARGEA